MSRKTTLKELAYILGYSISTVSKALNNSSEVGKETKIRIKELAKRYDYTPNFAARSLAGRKTKTIGVVLPNILPAFFAKLLLGIEQVLRRRGYKIITCITEDSYKKELNSLKTLSTGCVDGVIISLAKETQTKGHYSHLADLMHSGFETIMLDRVTYQIDCDKVVVDDMRAAHKATKYLMSTGCKSILFLSPICETTVGKNREKGYLKALKHSKSYTSEPKILNVDCYKKISHELIEMLKKTKIDAIIACDEVAAIYSLNTINSEGIKIPEEMSVIGFTDGILSENSSPPLTTVSQHGIQLGKMAANKLINRLEAKEAIDYSTTTIKTSLIKRKSTKNFTD